MIIRFTQLLFILFLVSGSLSGQESAYVSRVSRLPGKEVFPAMAIKTNLLYDATTTFNLGLEFRLSDYLSLDLSANYNPWTFSDNKKFKHLLIQPELRYWIYEPFNGHFLGGHFLYSNFNAGNLDLPTDILPGLQDSRYRGNGYGVGFTYGYQWILSPRWSLESSFGFGYAYLDYTRYECRRCGKNLGKGYKHYWGPTKLSLSLIYVIK